MLIFEFLFYLFLLCLVGSIIVGFLSIPNKLNQIIKLLEKQVKTGQNDDS